MDIYTIGHSNYPVEKLIDMLKTYNIDTVVDIRGTPYSKYNVQYNKETIAETLKKEGFIYIYMAKELAAQRQDKKSYNKEGYSDFEKVIIEEDLVGRSLRENGFNVKHILDDYTLASQEKIEEKLLSKYFSNRNQITIDSLLGNEISEDEMIKEGYRLANKEIGYRVEHLE